MYDLFRKFYNNKPIGILGLNVNSYKNRSSCSQWTIGLEYLIFNSKYNYVYVTPETMNNFDIVLFSITSVTDIINFVQQFPKEKKCKIIAGGQGAYSVRIIKDLIDVCVFGRAEGQLDAIIEGERFDNVWYKEDDYNFEKTYEIRQTKELWHTENSVGCKYKCFYCQYTWTRKLYGRSYSHTKLLKSFEDNLLDIEVKRAGHYTSSIDGLSETTRYKCNKRIKDQDIINKLLEMKSKNYSKKIAIRLFNIIGYPWENVHTVRRDLDNFKRILNDVDIKGTYIFLMLANTPFSPEPYTPFENLNVNIDLMWMDVFNDYGRNLISTENLEAFIMPQVNSPLTLLKRVIINRSDDLGLLINVLNEKKKDKENWKDFMFKISDKYELEKITKNYKYDRFLQSYTKIPILNERGQKIK